MPPMVHAVAKIFGGLFRQSAQRIARAWTGTYHFAAARGYISNRRSSIYAGD
jgi:hypothetical protein